MKARTVHYRRRLKNIFKNLKQIKWIQEIVKTFVIFCLSVTILFFVRKYSIGNYEGEKLQEYLKKQINMNVGSENIDIQIIYNNTFDILVDKKAIITFNKYITSKNEKGTNISIFERKDKSFIDELLGLQPKYKLLFCVDSDNFDYDFEDIRYEDWDNDGKYEFSIYSKMRYASRITNVCMIITKIQEKWQIIQPSKIQDIDEKINLDKYIFDDKLNKESFYEVYGLYNNGVVYQLKNPFNSALEVCYVITYDSYSEGDIKRKYVYSMQQYKDNKFVIDHNWNMGATLILDEPMDFENEQEKYWGIQVGNKIYYAKP